MIQRFVPNGPTSSTMHYQVFRNKNSADEQFDFVNQIYKRIMTEDKDLCAGAQKNLNAGVFVNGEMHPKMEKGPLFFQKSIRDCVTTHHKREQAAKQQIWPARQMLPTGATASQKDIDFCESLACKENQAERQDSLMW